MFLFTSSLFYSPPPWPAIRFTPRPHDESNKIISKQCYSQFVIGSCFVGHFFLGGRLNNLKKLISVFPNCSKVTFFVLRKLLQVVQHEWHQWVGDFWVCSCCQQMLRSAGKYCRMPLHRYWHPFIQVRGKNSLGSGKSGVPAYFSAEQLISQPLWLVSARQR